MRTLAKTALALSFIGATAIGTVAPVKAQSFYFGVGNPYHHRHYYNYYGSRRGSWDGCPPRYTVQCKPYRYGPWDIYGGRQSDYGM